MGRRFSAGRLATLSYSYGSCPTRDPLDLIQALIPRAARILLALNVMISNDAIYCTLVVQDIVVVEQPCTLVYKAW